MCCPPAARTLLAAAGTVAVLAAVLGLGRPTPDAGPGRATAADSAAANMARMWPVFGGTVSRNMVNLVDRNLPDEFDPKEGKAVKWKAVLGSRAYGGPTVAHGKILVGTNNENPRDPKIKGDKGVIMCFNEADGSFAWQATYDKLPSGQVHDWPREGICSTPVVEGDLAYYVTNRCTVVCVKLNPAGKTADHVWQYDMMKELNVFPHNLAACSPLIAGDLIFVVTANGVDEGHVNIPAPEAPSFIALNKRTGQLAWKDSSPGNKIMHGQWSNPTYCVVNGGPQIVFPGGDGWLRSFEPATGKLLWEFDANPKTAPRYELGGKGVRSDFIATPVLYEDKIYIGIGQDPEHYEGVGYLYCIDPTKRGDISPELVTKENPDPTKRETKPNPNSGQVWVYGGPDKSPDAKRDYVYGRTMSTCAIHEGVVYAAELAGYMHCLDAKTGKRLWVHDMKGAIWGSPLYCDGKVYIGTEDGDLWVYAHGKESKEPKKVEIEQPIRSTPVVANGTLYIMTESTLFAVGGK